MVSAGDEDHGEQCNDAEDDRAEVMRIQLVFMAVF